MSTIRSFIRREPVLIIAALAALLSCFFVPPDAEYGRYLDLRTLALLYCLMTVVAGLRQAGLFTHLAHMLCLRAGSVRAMGLLLVLMSFFSAMLITNDVALLTFVPFAVVVLGMAERKRELIHIVVLQTVAANLGSMLTPVGNPQNLYLFSHYDLSIADFFHMTFPIWALSLLLIVLGCLFLPGERLTVFIGEEPGMDRRALALYLALFTGQSDNAYLALGALSTTRTFPAFSSTPVIRAICPSTMLKEYMSPFFRPSLRPEASFISAVLVA